MSGVHWCPRGAPSSSNGGENELPSGELLTKTFDCPLGSSAFHTTWTPLASAATAGAVVKREYVNPDGQANGPSPQSTKPLPLNSPESNGTILATRTGASNEAPPSDDLASQMSVPGLEEDG